MRCIRVTAFAGLAAAALTALGMTPAAADPGSYADQARRTCEEAGLEYRESIFLPGSLPATATCRDVALDQVKFLPLPKDTYCTVPGALSAKEGRADGQGNCVA